MFKNKNIISAATIMALFNKQYMSTYKNDLFNSNYISIKSFNFKQYIFSYLIDFNHTCFIDITSLYLNNCKTTHNTVYNYRWDAYINILNITTYQISNSQHMYNAAWLERESSEMLGVQYTNSTDSRHLLLNYNDNINHINKCLSAQPTNELKTNWHNRKIEKLNNKTVEI